MRARASTRERVRGAGYLRRVVASRPRGPRPQTCTFVAGAPYRCDRRSDTRSTDAAACSHPASCCRPSRHWSKTCAPAPCSSDRGKTRAAAYTCTTSTRDTCHSRRRTPRCAYRAPASDHTRARRPYTSVDACRCRFRRDTDERAVSCRPHYARFSSPWIRRSPAYDENLRVASKRATRRAPETSVQAGPPRIAGADGPTQCPRAARAPHSPVPLAAVTRAHFVRLRVNPSEATFRVGAPKNRRECAF